MLARNAEKVYNRGVRVFGGAIIPTAEQLLKCFIICSWATKMYVPINIVRLDERTGNVFILAGEDIEIEIERGGKLRE